MPLDPNAVGATLGPIPLEFGWRDAVIYALGVSATELDYLYEARGPRILPTFWTALAFQNARPLLERVGVGEAGAMFGSCSLTVEACQNPPSEVFDIPAELHAWIAGIYGLGPLGVAELRFEIRGPNVAADVKFEMYYPGAGTPDLPRPPRSPRVLPPARPPMSVAQLRGYHARVQAIAAEVTA